MDDDDYWEPIYLEKCSKAVILKKLDMVVAGIIRHDDDNIEGRPQSIPNKLNSNTFLEGNPHIQGSNLFIKLQTLLHAGGFDEALTSTTDRDLCIRLADLGTVKYGTLNEHLVHHYAESSSVRLSSFGSDTKKSGLTQFYRKYSNRMSEPQKMLFNERCQKLFGCDINLSIINQAQRLISPISKVDIEELFILIGIISSPQVKAVNNLLVDIDRLQKENKNFETKVLVLENSGTDIACQTKLRKVIKKHRDQGLDIKFIDYDYQIKDVTFGAFKELNIKNIKTKSIAVSRTMIQHYLYLESQTHPGAVVWILDDDNRIDNLIYLNNATVIRGTGEIVNNIKRLKEFDIAIAIGTVTGDPPLPFLSCMRTQLVDFYHNLEWMAKLNPLKIFPNCSSENMELRRSYHDYYYDLSRDETDQLEFPFWYIPNKDRIVVRTAFKNMVEALPSLKKGQQIFRPLIIEANIDPLHQMIPSIHRGGNTFIFHISSLRDYPNIVPNIQGKDTRRSDMIWCLLNRYISGRQVIEVPIPVRQDRRFVKEGILDFNKLVEDIQGYAIYSSLQDVFLEKAKERQLIGEKTYGYELLKFSNDDIDFALTKFDKYLNERTLAFELSFMRIIGLLNSFKKYINKRNRKKYWWLNDKYCNDTCLKLKDFIKNLENEYNEEMLFNFRKNVEKVDREIIRKYFENLEEYIEKYRSSQPIISEEFKIFSETSIQNEFNVEKLKLLGYGEESIVFTDGKVVFKYFYHWKKHITKKQRSFITSLVGKFNGLKTLYQIIEVRSWGDNFCIVYKFEKSSKYVGGHLKEILLFLMECKDAGIIYRNIHPDNFVITKTGLKLIDYGSDIHPYSEDEFIKMIRRAYLMYKYHNREDLKSLMHKSINSIDFPEFSQFVHFYRGIKPRSKEDILDTAVISITESLKPKSILDYGCGKGKIIEMLSKKNIKCEAFDIDDHVIAQNKHRKNNIRYHNSNEINDLMSNQFKFDCIICNLVLCVIKDDKEFRGVLKNIKKKIKENGNVIISVCNPKHILIRETEIQQRIIPTSVNVNNKFVFKKKIVSTGNTRIDVHRPLKFYKKEFEKIGFSIIDIFETEGSDIEKLQPSSDFMIFHLLAKQKR